MLTSKPAVEGQSQATRLADRDSPPGAPEKNTGPDAAVRTRARRGFAAMSPERQREIARKGGRAAHRAGTAHEFTAEEARAAGRKGGYASHRAKESFNARGPGEAAARGRAP